jgi:plastocyanin
MTIVLALATAGPVSAQVAAPFPSPWAPIRIPVPAMSTVGGPGSAAYTGVVTPFGFYQPAIPQNTIVPSYPYILYPVPQPVFIPVVLPRPAVEPVEVTVVTLRSNTSPTDMRIKPETAITWMNTENRERVIVVDPPAQPGVTAEDARQTGVAGPNENVSMVFRQPGEYTYYFKDQPERRARITIEEQ